VIALRRVFAPRRGIPEGIALRIPEGIALRILEGIALSIPEGIGAVRFRG